MSRRIDLVKEAIGIYSLYSVIKNAKSNTKLDCVVSISDNFSWFPYAWFVLQGIREEHIGRHLPTHY